MVQEILSIFFQYRFLRNQYGLSQSFWGPISQIEHVRNEHFCFVFINYYYCIDKYFRIRIFQYRILRHQYGRIRPFWASVSQIKHACNEHFWFCFYELLLLYKYIIPHQKFCFPTALYIHNVLFDLFLHLWIIFQTVL